MGELGRFLPAASFALAAALTAGAVLLGLMLFHGSLASRAERFLTRLTRGRLSSFLEVRRASYGTLDARLRMLLGHRSAAIPWNAATALAGWLLEALET